MCPKITIWVPKSQNVSGAQNLYYSGAREMISSARIIISTFVCLLALPLLLQG